VASSDPEVKEQTVGAIAEFIKKNNKKV